MTNDDPKPGRYKHYKGNEYEVLGIGTHSESGEVLVIYKALYGKGSLWLRPRDMFVSEVYVDGVRKPRFEPIQE